MATAQSYYYTARKHEQTGQYRGVVYRYDDRRLREITVWHSSHLYSEYGYAHGAAASYCDQTPGLEGAEADFTGAPDSL